MAQRLKRLPAMQETWVQSLGREYPLEKEMASHTSILAWRIPWREETYVYLWLIHVDVWEKPTQYCKAIIL